MRGRGLVNSVRWGLKESIGSIGGGKSKTEEFNKIPETVSYDGKTKVDNPRIANAQKRIVNAAAKTGYPIWKDKELMANPAFRDRVMNDPVLGPKVQAYEIKQREESAYAEAGKTASNNLNLLPIA